MDSEDSEKEAEGWHNLRTSSRRLAKAPTREASDLVTDTRYAASEVLEAPEDFDAEVASLTGNVSIYKPTGGTCS